MTTPTLDRDPAAMDRLLRRTDAPITARPTWWNAWTAAFGGDAQLLCLDNGAALAPLSHRLAPSRTLARRQVSGGAPSGHGDICILGGSSADQTRLPASDGASARALADLVTAVITAAYARWHLRFEHLPPHDPVAHRLAEVLTESRWTITPERSSPFVALQPGTTLEDYLSRSWRKTHRRTARAFDRAGGAVRYTQDPSEIGALLPNMSAIRRARDHRCGRVSDLDSASGHTFWSSIILNHASRGEAEVAVAEVAGEMVGYDVILRDGPVDRLWDGRVGPLAESLSVGRHLQDLALIRALDRGCTELDLMRGISPAKLRLATGIRPAATFEAWSHASSRRRALSARATTGWVKTQRDSNPHTAELWGVVKDHTLLRGNRDEEHRRVR